MLLNLNLKPTPCAAAWSTVWTRRLLALRPSGSSSGPVRTVSTRNRGPTDRTQKRNGSVPKPKRGMDRCRICRSANDRNVYIAFPKEEWFGAETQKRNGSVPNLQIGE